MKRAFFTAALAVVLVIGPGCAHFRGKKPSIPEATLPTWLGRVVMVDEVHRFVLVDTGAAAAPAAGRNAVALRDKHRAASLRVTADTRPPYVAMEILEGLPVLGDQVALDETHNKPPNSP